MESVKFEKGKTYDLGTVSLTEKEIIDFATVFDPLEFHTNVEVANKSFFKGLVASGPHIFTLVHRIKWIPLFGKTVLAGLEIDHWKFLKPVYVNQKIHSKVTIANVQPNPEKGSALVTWYYEFKNEQDEMVQCLEMVILHKNM